MPIYELDCHDCGEPCEVYRSNGKYCRSCALLRKLMHVVKTARSATRRCRVCAERFAPLHDRDNICGHCDTGPPTPDAVTARCSICKEDTVFPHRGVTVCLPCLKTPTPAKPPQEKGEDDAVYEARVKKAQSVGRAAVIRALRKGQDARVKKNAGRERREIVLVEDPT